jgi:hypothetical protein
MGKEIIAAANKNGVEIVSAVDKFGTPDFNNIPFYSSLSEVKEHFLLYAREQILRYDAYGVDLDFMREPYCFMPGQEMAGAAHVREVVCRVRKYCDEAEAKFGGDYYTFDGVHPLAAGAKMISREWLKAFKTEIDK